MKTALFAFFLFVSSFFYGQDLAEFPLWKSHNAQNTQFSVSNTHLKITSDTLGLPFVEDFSTYQGRPDTSKWLTTGGAYVNHSYPVAPPSYNVVTLDGTNAKGIPYDQGDENAEGYGDTLTSRFLDLSIGAPLYLTFFVQPGGLGDPPDSSTNSVDFLELQFRRPNGSWEKAWEKVGVDTSGPFRRYVVEIQAPYHYKGFQFRFLNFGRISGNYDIWNIDYIKVDDDSLFNDLSFQSLPKSPLGLLESVPVYHFNDWKSLIQDTVRTTFINLNDNPLVFEYSSTFIRNSDNNVLINGGITAGPPLQPFATSPAFFELDTNLINLNNPDSFNQLVTVFALEGLGPTVNTDVVFNDTVKKITYLEDYYAYDDGSAESSLGFTGAANNVQLAVEYNSPLTDSISHVRMYWSPRGANIDDKVFFRLRIWSSLDEENTGLLYESDELLKVDYSNQINGFTEYQLDEKVIVSGDFYVGFVQTSPVNFHLGADKSKDARELIFTNVSGTWSRATLNSPVAPMIRPVFNKDPLTVNIEEPEFQSLKAEVFPNPFSEKLQIRFAKIPEPGTIARVLDLNGRTLKTKILNDTNSFLNLYDLSKGLYLLQINNQKGFYSKKIIKR